MSEPPPPDQRACSCNSQHSLAVSPGTYFIKNVMTGTVIDLRANGREEGTVIESWSYVGGNNQKWKLDPSGYDQSVILRSVHANSYIWVPYQLHAQEILTKASFTAQRWTISSADRGFYISPVQYPEYVLDLFHGSSAHYAKIGLWKNLQADNQKWYFIPA
ncbi:ricin B lectin domain-containing protein [Rhizoctonia solani]|nr:ricin B lectin domain-containing protein [Rhizoctonia solani]